MRTEIRHIVNYLAELAPLRTPYNLSGYFDLIYN